MTFKETTNYFLFSDGSYSDYAVGSLYKSEEALPVDAWYDFLESRNAEREVIMIDAKKKACERVGLDYEREKNALSIYHSPEYAEFLQWKNSQLCDDEVFQKMHNMVLVDYSECHGGM